MADEELHETNAQDQEDWQDQVETTDEAAEVADASTADKTADEDEDYGIPMDKVEAVLNATADKASLTPQMQRMMQRADPADAADDAASGGEHPPRGGVHQGHQVQPALVRAAVLHVHDHRPGLGRGLLPDRQLPDSGHRRVESGHCAGHHPHRIPDDDVVALGAVIRPC